MRTLTFLPTSRWALQASAGHLHEVEAEFAPQPRSSIERLTASVTYHRVTGASFWATTVAYGVNSGPEVYPGGVADLVTHAGLVETRRSFGGRHDVFGRFELGGFGHLESSASERCALAEIVSRMPAVLTGCAPIIDRARLS